MTCSEGLGSALGHFVLTIAFASQAEHSLPVSTTWNHKVLTASIRVSCLGLAPPSKRSSPSHSQRSRHHQTRQIEEKLAWRLIISPATRGCCAAAAFATQPENDSDIRAACCYITCYDSSPCAAGSSSASVRSTIFPSPSVMLACKLSVGFLRIADLDSASLSHSRVFATLPRLRTGEVGR